MAVVLVVAIFTVHLTANDKSPYRIQLLRISDPSRNRVAENLIPPSDLTFDHLAADQYSSAPEWQ